METFTWAPDNGPQRTVKPRVYKAKFGDGYEQVTSAGLNPLEQEWSLSFTLLSQATYNAISDFLEARKGAEAFYWVPPGKVTAVKVRCEEWADSNPSFGLYAIQAKFHRVYEV